MGKFPGKLWALFIPITVLETPSPDKDSHVYPCVRQTHPLMLLVSQIYCDSDGFRHSSSPGLGLATNHELVLSLWHLPDLTLTSSHITCNSCTLRAPKKCKCCSGVKKGICMKTFMHPLKEKWCMVYLSVLFVILNKHLIVQANSFC